MNRAPSSAAAALARVSRDVLSAERIPYRALLTPNIVLTAGGEYVQVLKIVGRAFESQDDEVVNAWHTRLNVLWRNIASPQVALWTHVLRAPQGDYCPGESPAGFARDLDQRYRERLRSETLFVNALYLTLVYRPLAGRAQRAAFDFWAQARPNETARERADSIDACAKLAESVCAGLAEYEPSLLGLERDGPRLCSQVLEFFSLLVNGESRRVPPPRAPVCDMLATSRLYFGTELLEQRTPTALRWGAMLAIKEYPTPTVPGMLNSLLAAPFPFVLTQSFTNVSKATAQGLLQRQSNRLVNAGDFAVSQAAALHEALDALTSNEFVMGEHHLSLQVQTPLVPLRSRAPEDAIAQLQDDVALARSLLADAGMTVAREDLALDAAFWAQLPGAFSWRPRVAVITSRNFAALAPFHSVPLGHAQGNHWGEALALLSTSARSPYFFSLHASDPGESDGGARRDTGHTLVCGPTGSGKTVLIGFLLTMALKFGVTQIVFDKDRGLEILVRALGGRYVSLSPGRPSGLNPLQLDATPENQMFLKEWLRLLVRPRASGAELTVQEEADLEQALRGVLALDVSARRLSRVLEYLDPTDPAGLHARLAPWCSATEGELAWVFDESADTVGSILSTNTLTAFDVGPFLDHAALRGPVTLYLLHLVEQRLDGRRLICWLDEFWRLLEDPVFQRFAKNGPKTWRKRNGVMVLSTQSAADALESPISRTLIEQTPTKVFFPNGESRWVDHEAMGFSEREHQLINQELSPSRRQFLVRQGSASVACELNLAGLEVELAAMSGRAATVSWVEELRALHGEELEDWWPAFVAGVAQGRAKS